MSKVIFEKDGRIGRIILNRPEKLNAIDDDIPNHLEKAVLAAEKDPGIHVVVLSGNGKAFCGGYDLKAYAEEKGPNNVYQGQNWDPIQDYKLCGITPKNSCHCGVVANQFYAKFMVSQ